MRKSLLKSMALIVAMFTCLSASAIDKLVKTTGLDGELTSVEDLYTTKFILENEVGQVLYTPSGWDIKVGSLATAIGKTDQGLFFQAEKLEDADVADYALIGVYNVDGSRRTFWAGNQCVNSQPVGGNVIFGLACTSPQYGQDGKNLGLWTMEYVADKGFTFHCAGRDVYIGYDSEAARPSETVVYWKAYKSYSASYDKGLVNAAVFTLDATVKIGEISDLLSSAKTAYESSNDIAAYGDALNKVIDAQNEVDEALASYANLKGEAAQTAYEAIKTAYGNGEYATVSDLKDALRGVAKLQTEAGADMTGAIINPSFETGTLEGWTSVNGGNIAGNFNFGKMTGLQFVERWTNSNNGGKLSDGTLLQTLTGMPNGTYTLTAEMQNLEQGNNNANGTGYYLVINDDKAAVETAGQTVSVTSKVKDGTLVIGAKLEDCSGNWVCIDNFQLTYVAPLEPDEENATEEDLKPLKAELDIAKSLGVDVSAWNDKAYTVAEVASAIQDVKVAEYAAVKAGYTMDASALVPAMTEWTSDLVSNKSQHWDGTSTSVYYEQKGALWSQTGWTAGASTMVNLPKGKYVIYAAGRSSANVNAYLRATDGIELEAEQTFPANGDTGKGIATNGEASFAEDATYANNGNGRGFEYRYIPFEVEDELVGINIAIGGTTAANHQWMSICAPVLLTTGDNANIVKLVLASDVKDAQTIVEAKAGVGDGLFQIPTEAYDTFAAAVEAAQAVADNADATAEEVKVAQQTLAEAVAAYKATPVTAPAADKQYVLSLTTSDENSPFQLSIASEKISVETKGTPVTFVAAEGGYAISNGTENIVYAGGNNWTLKASTDAYAWTIAAVEGGYTIAGKNGFLGTNTKDGSAAGSTCYGNKKSTDGFYIWTIAEYAASEPVLATIANDATVTLPEGELEVDEDGFVKATLTGKITVDESIAADAQAFLVYSLTEKTEDAGEETPEVSIIKGGVDISQDDEEDEYAELQFDVESQDINLAVEPGKKYTLTVKSIVVNYYDDTVKDMVVAGEKTFEGDEAVVIDFATASEPVLATIADDATVTVPEGELEVDENGYVHATFTGLITVDESIADKAGAVLYYDLNEVADESDAAIKAGEDQSDDNEEDTGDGEDAKLIKLEIGVESQEILIPAEAGKKYILTVNAVMAGNYYYDEDEQEELLNVEAAKEFVGDDALVITFATKAAPAPVLATLDFVDLATGDDATISEEDGTYPVVFSYGLKLDESIAAMASGAVTYTVYKGEDVVGTYETDFDVAKEERTIYVEGLEYSTAYTVKIDKVVISYFDLDTFESIVAGEFTEPTSSVSFTTNAKPEPVPTFDIAKEFTNLESLKGAVFTIVNKETGKALYGSNNQNLGYDVAEVAFDEANSGFYFKIDTLSQGTEDEAYALRLLTPAGDEYSIWGEPGYLNSQPAETGWCSFILGLNNQNGRDLKDGGAWDIQYVEGKGFTLLNKGTGKYLTSNDAAKSDEPVYWTFCTINGTKIATGINGINAAKAADGKYIENGKVVIVKNGKKISVAGFGIK